MLLQYLLQHRGRVLSRDVLLGDVWGYRYTGWHSNGGRPRPAASREAAVLVDGAGHRETVRLQARRTIVLPHERRTGMKAGFRTKVFLGAFAAAALSLLALAGLMAWQVRERQRTSIERHLSDEAYLIADLLSKATALDESDSIARRIASESSSAAASRSSPARPGRR